MTQLSQLKNTGELHALEDTWHGDQLKIEAPHGSIRAKHIDAVVEVPGKQGGRVACFESDILALGMIDRSTCSPDASEKLGSMFARVQSRYFNPRR